MVEYLNKKIAQFQEKVEDREQAFDVLAGELFQKGLVTEEYRKEISKRELIYPTGLAIGKVGIAIPHTDSDHVKVSQIGFMSLKKPVTFYQMGTSDVPVEVNLIFMLALKDPHEHPLMLQALVSMFQADGVLEELQKVVTVDDYIDIMKENNIE